MRCCRKASSISSGVSSCRISYSDGHSVVRSVLCPHANQLGIYFRFERSKFCKLSANDKKSRYTAHQISGRKSLAISLMKLCTGSEIQKPSMSAFSVPQADTALERRSRNLFRRLPCVSFRYSIVDSAMRARYSIAYRTFVCQVVLTYCSRKSGCRFRQPPLG